MSNLSCRRTGMHEVPELSAALTLRRFSILTTTSSRRSFQAKRNHTLQKDDVALIYKHHHLPSS